MSGNYAQLEAKAGDVFTAKDTLRSANVAAELATKEYEQAEANAARTEAEYVRRKDQSDAAADDLAAINARVTELEAQVTSLGTRRTDLFALVSETPVGSDRQAVVDKDADIVTKKGEITTAESNAQGHRDNIETENLAIVGFRAEEEQLEAEIASLKALIAELTAQRDSYPAGDPQIAIIQAQITTQEGVLATEEAALVAKQAQITASQATITSETADLNTDVADVATKIAELRVLEAEVITLRATLDAGVAEFTEVANKLEDIDGTPSDLATAVPLATEAAGSQLDVAKAVQTELVKVDTDLDTVEAAVKGERDTAASAVAPAKSASDSAQTTLTLAQTASDKAMDDLRVLVDKQKDIEVRAAAALLEDFLKNEDAVLAAAPTVSLAVQTEVDKTCPSSKVNELVSEFRAAYADEDEYKALLERIIENPFAVFFNQIEDPCFVLLSEAEVAAFRADVEARFRDEAQRLLRDAGKVSGGGVSRTVVIAAVVLVILVLAVLVYMQ